MSTPIDNCAMALQVHETGLSSAILFKNNADPILHRPNNPAVADYAIILSHQLKAR